MKIHIYHMKDLFNIIKYPYLKIVLQWMKMIMFDDKKMYSPKSNIWDVCIELFSSLDTGVNTKTKKRKTMHKYMIFVDTCVNIKKIVNDKLNR